MAKLRLSDSAKRDLAEIDEYGMVEFGATVADEYARGFRDVFALLREHPNSGPARPELGRGVRCIVYRRHRVFYVVAADRVQVLRIFHHSRDVRRAQLR
jgi:toxin ParE1/3/4